MNEKPPGEGQETAAHKQGPRVLWELNPDQWRLFAITFIAGVASIVVGAGLIGLALALARSQWVNGPNGQFVLYGPAPVALLGVYLAAQAGTQGRVAVWIGRVCLLGACAWFAVVLLWVIGKGAGIK
jgi:hypothetical protein